jgi:SAM-dependent methyltransferase
MTKKYWERKSLKSRKKATDESVKKYVLPRLEIVKKYSDYCFGTTTILDVGAGNGHFSYYLEDIGHTTCIDYSKKMLNMNPCFFKYVMDAHKMSFKDKQFDIVFCHALLHHVDDMNKVIREMKRVSKKYVIIMEPNRNNPIMALFLALVKEERMALKFSLTYLRNKMKENGLEVVESYAFGMSTPNKTPKFLIPILDLFNIPIPFGTTLVLVCEK